MEAGTTTRRSDGLAVPSPWIRRHAHLIAPGVAVLDLAAGGGRHARFFAGRGNPVLAVDWNLGGMADLMDGRVELLQADLETATWPLEGRSFGGIVVTNYLYRPLFQVLTDCLAAGGVILYETFAIGQEKFGRPSNPDYLLQPNELLAAFMPALTIVAYEHGIIYAPHPVAVQRVAAIRSVDLVAL